MFGIGGGELLLILIVVLLAVGPDQMPKMLKTVGKGLREVRRATRELQTTVGVDELLRDEDFRDPLGLKKPLAEKPTTGGRRPHPNAPRKPGDTLTESDFAREQPTDGVDLDLAYRRESDALVRAQKLAAAASSPSAPAPHDEAVIAAKLAAASTDEQAVIAAKLAAAAQPKTGEPGSSA